MKSKQKSNNNPICSEFKQKYDSMKTIINSLENISAKCELFFRQFNIRSNCDQQLSDYKKLLSGLKSQLGSEYVRQASVKSKSKKSKTVRKAVRSDCESDGQQIQYFDDYTNRKSIDDSVGQSCDQTETEQLGEQITDYWEWDNKSGKNVKYYGCPVADCDFKSNTRTNVVSHLSRHIKDKDHSCYWPNCEKAFGNKNSLLSHIESYHLRKERFKCCIDGCGQPFLSRQLLDNHMSFSHSDSCEHNCIWLECQLTNKTCVCFWPNCGKQFPNKDVFDIHIEDMHLKRRNNTEFDESLPEISAETQDWLKCEHNGCDYQTLFSEEMTEHKSKHKSRYVRINRRKDRSESDPMDVSDVNKYTGKPLSRKRRPKNYKCSWPACDAMFESQHSVKVHMRKHTGEKPFKCDWPDCGKDFRFKGALKLHKESIHLKLKQFKCDECDEAFLLQTALTVHKSKHTGIKRFQCDWPGCEWRTNFTQQLDIHRMRTHEGKKVYLKKYKYKKSDQYSEYDSRGILKPYPCEWPGCERRFRIEANLEPHMKWHQKTANEPNVKKYPKKSRQTKPKKEKPSKNAIKKEKQWRCSWPGCQSSYTSKSMMNQHYNTHTGQRPYQCSLCNRGFPYQSALNMHMNNYHPDQPVQKQFNCFLYECNRSFDTPRALKAHQRLAHRSMSSSQTSSQREPDDNWSSSASYCSPPPPPPPVLPTQPTTIQIFRPEPYMIRLERIRTFNTLQIQPQQIQSPTILPATYRRECMYSTHTTAKKLLTNALKRPKTPRPQTQNQSEPVNSESIARELPHPCTHSGCWRRFKTTKALDWHLKKFHSN